MAKVFFSTCDQVFADAFVYLLTLQFRYTGNLFIQSVVQSDNFLVTCLKWKNYLSRNHVKHTPVQIINNSFKASEKHLHSLLDFCCSAFPPGVPGGRCCLVGAACGHVPCLQGQKPAVDFQSVVPLMQCFCGICAISCWLTSPNPTIFLGSPGILFRCHPPAQHLCVSLWIIQ